MRFFKRKTKPKEIIGTSKHIKELSSKLSNLNIKNQDKVKLQNLVYQIDIESARNQIVEKREQTVETRYGSYRTLLTELYVYWDSHRKVNALNEVFFCEEHNKQCFKSIKLQKPKSILSGDFLFSFSKNQ